MKLITRKMLATSLTLAMVVPLAAACTKGEKTDDKQERVLKIATSMGFGDDEYFRQQFTEIFEFANPNIKVEMIPTMDDRYRYGGVKPGEKMPDPMEKLKEVMQGDNPPDVVMVGFEQLPEIIESNMLTQLDPLITKDKFDTTGIVPAVIDGIKNAGSGKLYALAPTFSSSALIYNKKMFMDAGVDFPKDGMTWDEIFDLSKRLTKGEGEKRINGFSFSTQAQGDLFYGMQMYTAPLQLKMFDDAGEKMTVDSDQWEKVWTKMAQLQKDNVFPELVDPQKGMNRQFDQENPFAYDDFMSNRLAMGIINYGQIQQITSANKNAASYKGFTPIDWDVVTIPSHPEAKGVGGSIYMNGIMGINAKAQNPDDAWKFIKFVNGDDWAKLKSHSSYNLVARSKYLKPKDGLEFHMEAFYNVIPAPSDNNFKIYRDKPNIYQVQEIGHQLFNNVLQGKTTAREALKEWQTQGDAMLKQMKENPTAPMNPMIQQAVPAG
ncbi:ABC transporter substrate-binding protein [Paenibacillus aceris]|uniref:Multiple sugar transport system substrate-binding protein n=1 Tax=Paenibacillus aceris TaxID=869555 RepID=A0ABS4HRV4_9BACL|nr:extracellular solute-binding protein [Paenibacillus aceris]MBP1961345.1 multiple sugar transport system substrate-binding protein [Paenibacillus aceris]NHW37871.1 extracellular solute-binding protein [Paenibacillus aceris]